MSDQLSTVYLIDDEHTHNVALEAFISKLYPHLIIKGFSDPFEGYYSLVHDYIIDPAPRLLILNLRMPKINGWQMLERLSELSITDLKIYICTSSFDPDDEKRALEHPLVSGYWRKPISGEILSERLQEILL